MTRTKQELRVGLDIIDACLKSYAREGGFFCRGVEREITPEIDALVKKLLGVKCHGGPIRNDDE